ncbi:MAG: LacI family DNA-binding transcriptional regulator [Ferruginibacter sp.]|nr:LacI family DNA-binding transcriptional regulator [Rhodoferax sp.]
MKNNETTKRSRRGSGAVTLRDVAKLAGVAPITASRAVNTPNQVSADVLQKVQAAIDRTGYVPNRLAGGLASSRSRLIAAVVPTLLGSVFLEMVESLNNTLFGSGYQLMLGQSGYSQIHEEALLDAIIGRRPDGIFLTGIMNPGKGRTRLLASGIPVVETWDLTPTPIDMLIGFSHAEIGQEVAKFLVGKGHKKLALIRADDERAARRASAFTEAVVRHGLGEPVVVSVGGQRSIKSGRDALGQVLAQMPDVDAIFCSSDMLATGAITEATARGIRVPEQLSVMGFGDVPFVADLIPALTTVHINGGEMGQRAAQYLVARAEGEPVDQPIFDVGFSIVQRDSA